MSDLVWLLVVPMFVLDPIALRAAPRLLSRLARFRVGEARSISLPESARRARIDVSAPLDYRTAPARRTDLAYLPGAPKVKGKQGVITFLEGNEVLAWPRLDFSNRARPLLRVQMREEDDRIVLTGRFLPSPPFAMLCMLILTSVLARSPMPILLFGLVYAIPYFSERRAARALFDAVEAEVASRVRRLDAEATGVRVEATGSVSEPGYVEEEDDGAGGRDGARPGGTRASVR